MKWDKNIIMMVMMHLSIFVSNSNTDKNGDNTDKKYDNYNYNCRGTACQLGAVFLTLAYPVFTAILASYIIAFIRLSIIVGAIGAIGIVIW